MPATATVETDELLDGDASLHVDRRLGTERALALPTPHDRPWFDTFHDRKLVRAAGEMVYP